MGANDAINLERLELLGDSLLKFASSLLVYSTSPPSSDEGQLTFLRIAHISNANLHRLSIRTQLFAYFVSGEFKNPANYLPPSYALADPVRFLATLCSKFKAFPTCYSVGMFYQ